VTQRRVLESSIVAVIQPEQRCRWSQALSGTLALHDKIMRRYLALYDRLRPTANEAVTRHLNQLDQLICGNLEWSISVPRCHGEHAPPGSPWSGTPADEQTAPMIIHHLVPSSRAAAPADRHLYNRILAVATSIRSSSAPHASPGSTPFAVTRGTAVPLAAISGSRAWSADLDR
jgi:hypothetical protein